LIAWEPIDEKFKIFIATINRTMLQTPEVFISAVANHISDLSC